MNNRYVKPDTKVIVINLQNSVMGEGDAAASGGADGGDGWANSTDFDDDDFAEDVVGGKSSLWD